ncbi:retention module-containing protein, partial [Aeromonas veronii]|uniref:retention module-containing protein n=1 Tax=Aeromonas veronii TaxID=654 RepID=UPI003EC4D161
MITNAVTLEQGVTVTQLKGQIYLVAADGSRKLLAEGDVLPKGAVIMSPDGASFMGGGQSFTVQPASEQSEPAEEGDAPQLAQNGAAGTPDDINALQQAILGGADPTQAFEASAAGGAPAAGGGGIGGVAGASGNGGFVTIDRTGSATIAEATFDTTYNANGEPPLEAVGEDDPLFTSANLVLSADAEVNEGGFITFTATLDEPVFGSDLVILLSNGAVITIPVGQSSGSVTVAAPADSPYVDPSTITVSITGTQGGGFNQIITGPSTTTQINDTVDTTTVILGAPAQVNEGGQITYSASVNNAPQSDLVLTLSNGASITIKAGELNGSVTVDTPSDDVYQDGSSLTVSITGSQGGNYEQLDTSSTVVTAVADTVDVTKVSLSATGSLTEAGGIITYTATLTSKAQGEVKVMLSNGETITIKDGETTGSVEVTVGADEDVYLDASSVSASITTATGGNFESLVVDKTAAVTQINDTVDTTTATLTATPSVTEGGIITYTVTLSHPAQGAVSVTLSNGQVITVADGQSSGSIEYQTAANDVYNNASTVSTTISAVTGGNFEKLEVNSAPAQTEISDSIDTTTVTLGSATNGQTVTEGGSIVYTASVSNPVTGSPLTVTLSNGVVITIPVGSSSANSEPVPVRADDAYQQGNETLSVSISGTSGGNYESVTTAGSVSNTVVDDSDVTTVTLRGPGSVVEGEATATYTVTLSNAAPVGSIVTLSYTYTTASGADITETTQAVIGADGKTAMFSIATLVDSTYEGNEIFEVSVSGIQVPAGTLGFEKLDLSDAKIKTIITDDADRPTLAVSDAGNVNEGSNAVFNVSLSNATEAPLVINLGLVYGT